MLRPILGKVYCFERAVEAPDFCRLLKNLGTRHFEERSDEKSLFSLAFGRREIPRPRAAL
jgi:hypothetical protein